MWEIDPVDLWASVVIVAIYSLPFFGLLIKFKLRQLKQRAIERKTQAALLKRLTGHD
jgi:hypothetical protein